MNDRLRELSEAGVSIWLDDISRARLKSGGFATLIRDSGVVGVTSNPTIFAAAVSNADDYAGQVRDLAERGVDVEEAVRMITTYDVRWACDLFRPVYDATDGVDGRVSIEVDPRMAHRAEATIAEARQLWWLVDRPNLMVKIPATPEGVPAISQALAEGISVNVTLIFGLDRYSQVMNAFIEGVERARAAGHDLATISSVASFFVSRVDSEVDKRLEAVGSALANALRGKAAIANARLAHQLYEEAFGSERWESLAAAGAKPQRPLWASTSTKDPSYPDTMYVSELITPGTVNTMPQATLEAYADHGVTTEDTVRGNYADARRVMDELAAVGIDYDDVIDVLDQEGIEKFEASWSELLATVTKSMKESGE
jgi:transaldolase